jgi:hypothetical protein
MSLRGTKQSHAIQSGSAQFAIASFLNDMVDLSCCLFQHPTGQVTHMKYT